MSTEVVTITEKPSGEPSVPASPSSSSSSSSSPPVPAVKRSVDVLAWLTFAVVSYAWLVAKAFDRGPWWAQTLAPPVILTINALPGRVTLGIARAVIAGLADKLPSLSKKQ